MGTYKRNKRWYYDFMLRRVRYRSVVPEARTKAQAERVETQARQEVFEGKYGGHKAPTLASFIEEVYLPWAKANKRSYLNDETHCRAIVGAMGRLPLDQVTPWHVEKFRRERLQTLTRRGGQRSPTTVNLEVATLCRIFSLAKEYGNPCRSLKRLRQPSHRERYLTIEEEQQLMGVLTGHLAYLRPIILIAINTGMRRGEIYGLEWERVDFSRDLIRVTRTKTDRDRVIPINPVVREVLDPLWNRRGGPWVFADPRDDLKPRSPDWRHFREAWARAGLTDFHFHDLRHTAGTRMGDAGVNLKTIAEVLGHSRVEQSARYTHATDEAKRRAVEALGSYGQGQVIELERRKQS